MPRNENDESQQFVTPDDIYLDSRMVSNNGSNTVTISNVAPAAVGTATIGKWLRVNLAGTNYYIPMWT